MDYINYAHRGASSYAPENTLRSFYRGLEMKANGIETDIQRTKDGVLVLFHDDTMERITGDHACISDFTYEELLKKDFGRFFGPEFANEKIVTFKDFLKYFGGKDLHLALETKQLGIEADTVRMAGQYASDSSIVYTSFIWDSVVALRECSPTIKIGYLTYTINNETLDLMERHHIDQICPEIARTSAEDVRLAESRGFTVRFWGVKDETLMRKAISLGGTGMTVNFPDKLKAALDEMA